MQALPSSQGVPSGTAELGQVPVAGLQVTCTWQAPLGAGHVTGLAPVHVPAWQVSTFVQALPSSQGVPSGTAELGQAPVTGSQVTCT